VGRRQSEQEIGFIEVCRISGLYYRKESRSRRDKDLYEPPKGSATSKKGCGKFIRTKVLTGFASLIQ
jgi:hypothetical protein